MFSVLKLKIANYILEKNINKNHRRSKLITLSKTKKVGLLFDAEDEKSVSQIKTLLRYFLKQNITVNVLGFVNKSTMDSYHLSTLYFNYFNLKNLNLLGIPNSKKIQSFLSEEYDMLINLSLKDSFCNRYLTLKSNSKYRVGVFSKKCNFNYDLMLKLKIQSLDYFIKQLIYYLELIDGNNEK